MQACGESRWREPPDARTAVLAQGARYHAAHRGDGGAHHLPDDGLHHVHQPEHPGRCRDAEGRGIRRHLPGGRDRFAGDGAARELSDRARTRHGPERLLRLCRGARHGLPVAGSARRGVHLGRAVPADHAAAAAERDRGGDPGQPARRDHRGHWPVPGDDRAAQRRHRGIQPGDLGDAGRPAPAGRDPRRARLHHRCRALGPPGAGRPAGRHPGGDRAELRRRRQQVRGPGLAATLDRADLPRTRHTRRLVQGPAQRRAGVLPGRTVRRHRDADGDRAPGRPAGQPEHRSRPADRGRPGGRALQPGAAR